MEWMATYYLPWRTRIITIITFIRFKILYLSMNMISDDIQQSSWQGCSASLQIFSILWSALCDMSTPPSPPQCLPPLLPQLPGISIFKTEVIFICLVIFNHQLRKECLSASVHNIIDHLSRFLWSDLPIIVRRMWKPSQLSFVVCHVGLGPSGWYNIPYRLWWYKSQGRSFIELQDWARNFNLPNVGKNRNQWLRAWIWRTLTSY